MKIFMIKVNCFWSSQHQQIQQGFHNASDLNYATITFCFQAPGINDEYDIFLTLHKTQKSDGVLLLVEETDPEHITNDPIAGIIFSFEAYDSLNVFGILTEDKQRYYFQL